jgi:hypothetical protein
VILPALAMFRRPILVPATGQTHIPRRVRFNDDRNSSIISGKLLSDRGTTR